MSLWLNWIRVELSLMLRPTVSRPVCLGIKHPSGAYDQIIITERQFLVCCGAPPLTRGRRDWIQVKVKVTLRLTVSQSVSLGVETHLGLMTRYIRITIWQLRSCFCGAPSLTRGLVCLCCWPLPAQSFSGPSSLGLVTLFYSLRFETSLFVASYDSQGYGGGIRPRLHTGGDWIHKWIPFYNFEKTE
jgi:hypothetical protein